MMAVITRADRDRAAKRRDALTELATARVLTEVEQAELESLAINVDELDAVEEALEKDGAS